MSNKNKESEKCNGVENKQSPLLMIYHHIHTMIGNEIDFRLGKILTIIDATIIDDRQNKGIKDLIKSAFREKSYHFSDLIPLLEQFKGKFLPEIEDGCRWKVRDERIGFGDAPEQEFFPENK